MRRCFVRSASNAGCLAAATLLLSGAVAQEVFEVASIKTASHASPVVLFEAYPGGRVIIANYTLRMLTRDAYQLVTPVRVSGGPPWVDREPYDITGRPPAGSRAAAFIPPPGKGSTFPYPDIPGGPEILSMVRSLLADRFNLKVHRETRQMDVLALMVRKRPPSLEPAHDPSTGWIGGWGKDKDEWRNTTMAKLAERLEAFYQRPVIDRTGLTGIYDFHLSYDQRLRDIGDNAGLSNDATEMSFKSAVEALGLAVVETKAPVEILVIDSATRPSAN